MKTKGKQNHLVFFEPSGRRGRINEGKTILEAAQELGVDLQNVCGDQAQCGKCKVLIVDVGPEQHGIVSRIENLSPVEEAEKKIIVDHELSNGWRL
ncbi:MAG: 2Fe-2S iron-sulfur cluster binding domain-containing protein, partial [Candidatus Aminicenantes bacterium]